MTRSNNHYGLSCRADAMALLPVGSECKKLGTKYAVRLPDGQVIARAGNTNAVWHKALLWAREQRNGDLAQAS